LHSAVADGVDVVYERDATQTIFDGNWKKHNLSESAYREKFAAADGRYARLLSELGRRSSKPNRILHARQRSGLTGFGRTSGAGLTCWPRPASRRRPAAMPGPASDRGRARSL